MIKRFMMAFAIVVVPMSLHAEGQAKVDICHIDDTGTYHLITIADPAYAAHMAHGDKNVATYYIDQDSDGYGSPAQSVQGCTRPPGYADNSADCNDNNAAVNPSAEEVLDGIDNNCDGKVDDCVQIRLHCDPNSDVLQTVCGSGVHLLNATAAANISYVTFRGDTSSVVLHHCADGSGLDSQTLEISGNTNLCDLQGGCCGDPRWNDSVCSVEIK